MEKNDNVRYMSNSESNKVTREAIDLAMLDLLEKQDFDRITIMSIVKRAGVSRQSFYRNYTSKEDIIIEIEEKILQVFSESLNDKKYENNLSLWFRDFFIFISQNKKYIAILIKANLTDVLFSKAPFIVEDWMGKQTNALHYYIVGNLSAIKSVAIAWFEHGMKESPDEMSDICMKYDIASFLQQRL